LPVFPIFAALSVAAQASPGCALSPSDQAWVDQSMSAWNYAARAISGIGRVKSITAYLFDDRCVITSASAMNGGPNRWTAGLHHGTVALPGGESIKPQVISFANSSDGHPFFVMSTPGIWRAAGKTGKGTTLEKLMTAVMLHEGTHVAQVPTYGAAIGRIAERYHLPDDFSDDSIQKQFGKDAEFAASVERESALLMQASEARNRREAERLVRAARDLMRARYARWFTGRDAYHSEAEPLWLTMEGSAQWVSYQWEIDPRGGKVRASDVRPGFVNDKWWSQREGFAAFMALDRLTGAAWKRQAFHLGRKNILEMLDDAASERVKR